MAKCRILKKENSAYLELPREISDYDELELAQVKPGIYILTVPENKKVTSVELAVLRKLNSIRFEKRTPEHVDKELTEAEKLVVKNLERKGLVSVFRGRKYKDGVYSIKDSVYPLLRGKKPDAPAQKGPIPKGFLTLNDKNEAFKLSQSLSQEMKRGDVIGIKGFDGKFYVVTKQYLEKSKAAISSVLKGDMDIKSIADAARMDVDGCSAVMRIMAESGEVLEKKKGLFAAV